MDSLRHSIHASVQRQRQKWAWLFALGRIVAGMLLWPVLGAIAFVISTVLHLQTPLARTIAAERVGTLVSDLVVGELHIGRFDHLALDGAVARHVTFRDGQGRRVIVADTVTLSLNLPVILYGTIHIPSAQLSGGTVRLIEGESGLPTMIEGFIPVDDSPSLGPTINAVVENIELRNLTLYGELLGLQGIRVEDLRANAQLLATPAIEFQLSKVHGRLVAPFPFEAAIEDLHGTITDDARRGIELHAQLSRGDEHATASVTYAAAGTSAGASEDSVLDLRVHAAPIQATTLHDVGYGWAAPLSTALRGNFRLHGPVDSLGLSAQLDSDGGAVNIDGLIDTTRGVAISVQGQDLALQRIVPKAPALRVSGLARIELNDSDPNPIVHLEVEPLLYDKVAVPAFELDGHLVEDGVRIDQIRATHVPGGLSGSGHLTWDGRVRGHVRANFPDIARDANLRRFVPDLKGALRAEIDLDVDPDRADNINFRGNLVLLDVVYGALSAKRLEISGYARGNRNLPRVDLRAKGEVVRAEGYLLGDADLAVKGAAPEYQATGEFRREGQRAFHIDARVQANQQRVILSADQLELAVGEETWRGTVQELELVTGRSLSVKLFRLASRSQRLEARGIVRFDGDDEIDAQLQGFDVAALRAIFGPTTWLQAGYLDTNLELRGDLKRPQLLMQGAITAATVKSIEDINGLYFLTYQNGALEIDTEVGLGTAGTWTLSGAGTLDTQISNPLDALRAGNYDLKLTASESELPALASLFDVTLPLEQAVMSGVVLARGTLVDPAFETDLSFSHVRAEGLREIASTVRFEYGDSQARVQANVVDAHGELLTTEASTGVRWADVLADPQRVLRDLGKSEWRLHVTAPQRPIAGLPFDVGLDESIPLTLGGEVRGSRLRGRLSVNATADAGWAGELPPSACDATPIPTGNISATLAGDSAGVLLKLGFDGHNLLQAQTNFQLPLARWLDGGEVPFPSDLRGYIRSDIAALERVPYVCDYATGRFYMQTQLERLWTTDPSIQMELRSLLRISTARKRRRRSVQVPSCPDDPLNVEVQVSGDSDWATANASINGCGGGDLLVSARSPIEWIERTVLPVWDARRPLDVRATLRGVQLKPLLDRIPGVFSAQVVANGDVTVSGTPLKPSFGGSLELHQGAMRLSSTGQSLSEIAGRVVLHPNWVEVQELHTRDERGKLQLSGGVGFEGWTPRRVRLAASSSNFPIRREGTEMASITSEALLQATLDDDQTGIDLAFASLAISLPDDTGRTLQDLEAHPDVEVIGRSRPKGLVTKRPIGIHVHSDRPFWVRRSDFSALIAADLNVLYDDPEVAVGGHVEFNRGVFDVFGKSFNLERGSIRFDGGTNLNPELNLIAEHDPQTAGSAPVRVTVTGRLSAPDVRFTAEGCEDESGALSLLLTGRCNLSDSTGPDNNPEAQRTAFVGGLLAGVLTLGAKRELGGLIPVIGIESTGSGFNQRIRAGIDADTLVPKFLRPIVRRAYVEGAVTTGSQTQGGTTGPASVDFLLELYFPHNIVGAGRVTPGSTQVQWGLDATWEP